MKTCSVRLLERPTQIVTVTVLQLGFPEAVIPVQSCFILIFIGGYKTRIFIVMKGLLVDPPDLP